QIRAEVQRQDVPFDVRRYGQPPAEVNAPMPWDEPAPAAPPSRRARLAALPLPAWLQNVVSPQLLATLVLAGLGLGTGVGLLANWISALGVLLLGALLLAFWLWWRVQKFRRQLAAQLPPFIDSMVRLITIGNS